MLSSLCAASSGCAYEWARSVKLAEECKISFNPAGRYAVVFVCGFILGALVDAMKNNASD